MPSEVEVGGEIGPRHDDEGAFVRAFDRLFDMYRLGLSLPQNYLGSETISDTLIA